MKAEPNEFQTKPVIRIAENIEALLIAQGKKWYWLQKNGISGNTVNRIKKDQKRFDVSVLLRLCVLLNCTPADIITLEYE